MRAATVQAVWQDRVAEMNNKAKTIAVCGISAAVAAACLACCALPGIRWVVLILAVVASLAVTMPLVINPKNIVYALLTYLAAAIVGVLSGLANVLYTVPIIAIFMPTAIVKVYGESTRIVQNSVTAEPLPTDPFETEPPTESSTGDVNCDKPTINDGTKQTAEQNNKTQDANSATTTVRASKPRLPRSVRWAIYYLLLEIGIAVTLLVAHLVTPTVFDNLVHAQFFVVLLVAAQAVPPLYVQLLSACQRQLVKIVRKVIK